MGLRQRVRHVARTQLPPAGDQLAEPRAPCVDGVALEHLLKLGSAGALARCAAGAALEMASAAAEADAAESLVADTLSIDCTLGASEVGVSASGEVVLPPKKFAIESIPMPLPCVRGERSQPAMGHAWAALAVMAAGQNAI